MRWREGLGAAVLVGATAMVTGVLTHPGADRLEGAVLAPPVSSLAGGGDLPVSDLQVSSRPAVPALPVLSLQPTPAAGPGGGPASAVILRRPASGQAAVLGASLARNSAPSASAPHQPPATAEGPAEPTTVSAASNDARSHDGDAADDEARRSPKGGGKGDGQPRAHAKGGRAGGDQPRAQAKGGRAGGDQPRAQAKGDHKDKSGKVDDGDRPWSERHGKSPRHRR